MLVASFVAKALAAHSELDLRRVAGPSLAGKRLSIHAA
jgi:hypothetical protein